MDEKIALENGDNKYFIAIIYKQSLIFESKNEPIRINLNQSIIIIAMLPKNKDLVCIKLL